MTLKRSDELVVSKPPQPKHARCLFYGDAGSGKTWLAATADDVLEMKPVLFCDADKGLLTIAARQQLDVVEITDLDYAFKVVRYLRTHPGKYQTVVIDGLMAIYNKVMARRLQEVMQRANRQRDAYVPERDDWMHSTFRVRALIEALKNLPMNVIATTSVESEKNEQTGVVETMPNLPGKLAREVGQMFDIVGYLYVKAMGKKITRMLQIQPFGQRTAKNRSPYSDLMGTIITSPTMMGIYHAAILGDITKMLPAGPDEEAVEKTLVQQDAADAQAKPEGGETEGTTEAVEPVQTTTPNA